MKPPVRGLCGVGSGRAIIRVSYVQRRAKGASFEVRFFLCAARKSGPMELPRSRASLTGFWLVLIVLVELRPA